MKKYTLKEIKTMLSKDNFFGYKTPIGKYADELASNYDYNSDTFDCEEAIRDAFIYGVHWVINHLKQYSKN